MKTSLQDVVVDKSAVMAEPCDLIADWLWLVPDSVEIMLPTACGDLFLMGHDGGIAFLDTYVGSCTTVAPTYEKWKELLNSPAQSEEWFRATLVADLLQAGLTRQPGQCFSPLVPQVVNGSWEPDNFHTCDLIVHLVTSGQIHQQVKDLPPGTKISGFNVVEE